MPKASFSSVTAATAAAAAPHAGASRPSSHSRFAPSSSDRILHASASSALHASVSAAYSVASLATLAMAMAVSPHAGAFTCESHRALVTSSDLRTASARLVSSSASGAPTRESQASFAAASASGVTMAARLRGLGARESRRGALRKAETSRPIKVIIRPE